MDLEKSRISACLSMATVQNIGNVGEEIKTWTKHAESLKFKFSVLILRLKN